MMYFSRLKTTVIVAVCVLGVLLCLPNLFAAPGSAVPWRQVHLGLDLRGGSYLLLEVDMGAVVKERLETLADSTRQALVKARIQYQDLIAQPTLNRVSLCHSVSSPSNPTTLTGMHPIIRGATATSS